MANAIFRIAKGYLSYTGALYNSFFIGCRSFDLISFLFFKHVFHLVFAALAVDVAEVAIPSCRAHTEARALAE